MEITDIRIKLVQDSGDRLKAVCTVTFDGSFVVRDVKVVAGSNGLFVAMPSRKLMVSCPTCRFKNHLRAKHCNECGGRLSPQDSANVDPDGRNKLHRDIAHPITPEFRSILQDAVIQEYEAQLEEAGEPEALDREEEQEHAKHEDEQSDSEEELVARDEPSTEETDSGPKKESTGDDDYNSMIADLRGGRGGGEQRNDDRSRGDSRRGGSRRDDRSTRGPRRESAERPKSAPRAVERTRPPVREQESREKTPDAVALEETAAEPAVSEDVNEDSTPFGMGLL